MIYLKDYGNGGYSFMIKRIGLALLLLLIGLLLPSPNYFIGDKNKTYDNEFINSLAKGLNNRWGIVYLNDKDKVKDKDKVSFETYAKDDGYITILLYNKKPFGYVTTDKDGYKTNHVTTFYVSDVAADA